MHVCVCYTLSLWKAVSLPLHTLSLCSKMNPVEIKWEARAAAASFGWLFVHSLTLPCPKGFSNEQTDSAVLTDFYCVQGVHNLLARVTAIQ